MARTHNYLLAVLGLATMVAAAGCAMDETSTPALTGPSSFGLNLSVYAEPDELVQDGRTSTITVKATNENGQPRSGLDVRLDMYVPATIPTQPPVLADIGELSSKLITTGSNGEAVAIYTTRALASGYYTEKDVIILTITATPVGRDYSAALARSVKIRLVPPGTIIK